MRRTWPPGWSTVRPNSSAASSRNASNVSGPPAMYRRVRSRALPRSSSGSRGGNDGVVVGEQVSQDQQVGNLARLAQPASPVVADELPGRDAAAILGAALDQR